MSGVAFPRGSCVHRSHVGFTVKPPCWTADDVATLEARFGTITDRALARQLGRSVVGMRLKAKRLGLHKRDVGLSAGAIAEIFGVDDTIVSKIWIRRRILRATRSSFAQGRNRMWVVADVELLRFIRQEAHWFDAMRMPASAYRELALEGGRWFSLPDVMYLTGRHPHVLSRELASRRWPARRRGSHWMVHESTIPAIAATAGNHGRFASTERYQATLEHRRNVRKGIAERRPHEPRHVFYTVVDCPEHADDECATCQGKGVVLRGRLNGIGIQPLPEEWAA